MCCYDNPPEFYEQKGVRGRKEHQCCECLRVIEKGELHQYAKGVWDGVFQVFRTCQQCLDLIYEAKDNGMECYCFGELFEEFSYGADELEEPSASSFLERRRLNYERLESERKKREMV